MNPDIQNTKPCWFIVYFYQDGQKENKSACELLRVLYIFDIKI